MLLIEEAGGRVTDFAGQHYRLDSREILASNGLIHDELIALFADMFAGKRSGAHRQLRANTRKSRNREQGIGNREAEERLLFLIICLHIFSSHSAP